MSDFIIKNAATKDIGIKCKDIQNIWARARIDETGLLADLNG
jgi:hypothetical protein